MIHPLVISAAEFGTADNVHFSPDNNNVQQDSSDLGHQSTEIHCFPPAEEPTRPFVDQLLASENQVVQVVESLWSNLAAVYPEYARLVALYIENAVIDDIELPAKWGTKLCVTLTGRSDDRFRMYLDPVRIAICEGYRQYLKLVGAASLKSQIPTLHEVNENILYIEDLVEKKLNS